MLRSEISVGPVVPHHLEPVTSTLAAMGCRISTAGPDTLQISPPSGKTICLLENIAWGDLNDPKYCKQPQNRLDFQWILLSLRPPNHVPHPGLTMISEQTESLGPSSSQFGCELRPQVSKCDHPQPPTPTPNSKPQEELTLAHRQLVGRHSNNGKLTVLSLSRFHPWISSQRFHHSLCTTGRELPPTALSGIHYPSINLCKFYASQVGVSERRT